MTRIMNLHIVKPNIDTNKMKDGVCRVGFFENSKYSGGKSVSQVARYNEFGLGVPMRPFMRPAVIENRSRIREILKSEYKRSLKNNDNTMLVLGRLGQYVQGLIQAQIVNTYDPPNAPSTIKRKGFNKPLVDTGVMLASVRHQEEEVLK